MKHRRDEGWSPSAEQMGQWPGLSGNTVNGVGEAEPRRPKVVYWQMPPESIPHGPLQLFFYNRTASADERVVAARRARQHALEEPLAPLAAEPVVRSDGDWTAEVKRAARAAGADDVGITAMQSSYVFADHAVPTQRWMIILAVEQQYEAIAAAPSTRTLVEITHQYARGIRVAKALASWLRLKGHDALPYGGPMAGSFVFIPAAIEAGLGELGKHGSMIHRRFGANFRLACVLTDVPLIADTRDDFGADDFCTRCQVCSDACPPAAIVPEKQLVRGERRWYVDFDKCLPYFNENMGCGICLAVCPFSLPGVGPRLVDKLAIRRQRREAATPR